MLVLGFGLALILVAVLGGSSMAKEICEETSIY